MAQSTSSTRRTLIKTIAAAATLGGCTTAGMTGTGSGRYDRPLSRQPFVAPRISHDRIVRVIVGLRPYRPSGFVVKREEFDAKTVIHNYGHGGGGITLSWGSSALAVRESMGMPVGEVAVVGGGIMGLTTARLLQDAGWKVTIYTRDVTRHSTSNVGAGQWGPTSVFEEGVASKAFEEQYKFAARIAHHAFQNLSGADYGIRFLENYFLGNEPIEESYYLRELPELFTSVAHLEPHEHPFPVPYVERMVTMLVEPAIFLRRIRADFYRAGGKFVIRNFQNRSEVLSLNEPVIFNCTGLGAKALFGDEDLMPIKGQLVFMQPDPAVDYLTIGGGSGVTYMFPRKGEILLGGSYQFNDWTRHVEADVTDRIIEDNKAIFDNLRT
jgi:D-amino-acid oxidase